MQRFQAAGEIVPTAKVPVGDRPEAISLGKQLVWVANVNDNTVNRIDRASPAIVGAPIGVGSKPSGIFVGRRFVWVANNGDDTVTRIDPSTAEVVGDPIAVGTKPRGVIETDERRLGRELRRRHRHPPGPQDRRGRSARPRSAATRASWPSATASCGSPTTTTTPSPGWTRTPGRVVGSPIPVGQKPLGIASGAGAVWVANHADHSITRIQP